MLRSGGFEKVAYQVRRLRTHPALRDGSSVCGDIDMAAVATSLASVRGSRVSDRAVSLDAALVALSGRVRLREGSTRTTEDVVTELWNEVFAPAAEASGGKASAPTGATH